MARLTARLMLRCTPEEVASWRVAAKAEGLSVSEWARRRIGGVPIEVPPPPKKPKRQRR